MPFRAPVLSFRAQSRNLPSAGKPATSLVHGHVRCAGGAGHSVCLWRACEFPRIGGCVLFAARPLGFARGDKSGASAPGGDLSCHSVRPSCLSKDGASCHCAPPCLVIPSAVEESATGRQDRYGLGPWTRALRRRRWTRRVFVACVRFSARRWMGPFRGQTPRLRSG